MSELYAASLGLRPHSGAQGTGSELLDQIDQLKLEVSQLQISEAVSGGSRETLRRRVVHSTRLGTQEVVRSIINARAERQKFLPENLFAEPAWDMLLDLYLGDILGKRISVSSLCTASNVPASTALRWIRSLGHAGLVDREGDHFDGRRYYVSLSEAGLARMDAYFESLDRNGVFRLH